MNVKYKDVHILIAVLLVCGIITLFHVRGITADVEHNEKNEESTRPLESLNAQDALDYVMPLIISGNINGAASLLVQNDPIVRNNILNLLLEQEKSSLNSYNKLLFLVALAHAYAFDKKIQYEIFDTIEEHREQLPYTYTLLYATQNPYQDVIDAILSWIDQKKDGSFVQTFLFEGIKVIINANKPESLDVLLSKKAPLSAQQATELLRLVITQQRNAQFVPLLVNAGADVNGLYDATKTFLIQAVEFNNVELVHALLQEGANPNLIISPSEGSAVQLAVEKRYVKIELLLRQYGGRE